MVMQTVILMETDSVTQMEIARDRSEHRDLAVSRLFHLQRECRQIQRSHRHDHLNNMRIVVQFADPQLLLRCCLLYCQFYLHRELSRQCHPKFGFYRPLLNHQTSLRCDTIGPSEPQMHESQFQNRYHPCARLSDPLGYCIYGR